MPNKLIFGPVQWLRPLTAVTIAGATYEPTDLLVCKDIGVAKAEVNANNDDISAENIDELAASLALKPISLEHKMGKMLGIISAARRATALDGKPQCRADLILYTRHTPPEVVEGTLDGSYSVSVEADMEKAVCSVCGGQFAYDEDYCEHIQDAKSRKRFKALRSFKGMTGTGAAVVKRPAGSETAIPKHAVAFVAYSEQEDDEMQKCKKCGEDCGDGGKELKGSMYCGKCAPEMEASLNAAETAATEQPATEAAVAALVPAPDVLGSITKLGEEFARLIATVQERLTALEGNLSPKLVAANTQAESMSAELKAAKLLYRKAKLVDTHLLTAAEFESRESDLLGASDEFIAFVAGKLAAKETTTRSDKPKFLAFEMNPGNDGGTPQSTEQSPKKIMLAAV